MSDSEIDLMLKSDKIDSLRRFRNGVFHFHKSYFDDRFLELFSADGVQWALDIHKEFDRYFKVWFESQGYSIEFSSDTNGNLTTTVSTPPND